MAASIEWLITEVDEFGDIVDNHFSESLQTFTAYEVKELFSYYHLPDEKGNTRKLELVYDNGEEKLWFELDLSKPFSQLVWIFCDCFGDQMRPVPERLQRQFVNWASSGRVIAMAQLSGWVDWSGFVDETPVLV